MGKTHYKIVGAVLYLLSIAVLIFYFSIQSDMVPLYRVALLMVVCLMVYYAGRIFALKVFSDKKVVIMKSTFAVLLATYLLLLVTLTFFDSYFGRSFSANYSAYLYAEYLEDSLNLVPFKTICLYINAFSNGYISAGAFVTNIIGNILAFIPFALFLPLLFKPTKSFAVFTVAMLFIVATVEFMQLVTLTGSCDIDDLLLNVGGACAFYAVLHIPKIRSAVNKFTLLEY